MSDSDDKRKDDSDKMVFRGYDGKINFAEFDKHVDLNWGPTLMKAEAWEACMEGRSL